MSFGRAALRKRNGSPVECSIASQFSKINVDKISPSPRSMVFLIITAASSHEFSLAATWEPPVLATATSADGRVSYYYDYYIIIVIIISIIHLDTFCFMILFCYIMLPRGRGAHDEQVAEWFVVLRALAVLCSDPRSEARIV